MTLIFITYLWYECLKCAVPWKTDQANPLTECPKCGGPLRRTGTEQHVSGEISAG